MNASHRLTSADFRRLRPTKRLHGRLFSLSTAPSPAGLKWTVVVSKKVAAKASARNLIKRRSRAALQRMLAGVDRPLALVFTAKRGCAAATSADIERDLAALLQRIGAVGARSAGGVRPVVKF